MTITSTSAVAENYAQSTAEPERSQAPYFVSRTGYIGGNDFGAARLAELRRRASAFSGEGAGQPVDEDVMRASYRLQVQKLDDPEQ